MGKARKLNLEYVRHVNGLINDSPFFRLLSMKVLDMGFGFSLLEIELAEKHIQPFGFVHGGVFASLIDAAAFWAVFCEIEGQDAGATTVDLKLNYLAAAQSGRLIARGRRLKLGKTLGYAEVSVTDEKGKLLAHGASTLMILPTNTLLTDQPLPAKYL
jgi:uncharacterized protein (TIGR00369 family)